MEELVSISRGLIHNKKGLGLKIPNWIGLTLGYLMDVMSLLFNKRFAVNSARIKKFLSNTSFISNSEIVNKFQRPYDIREALEKTIKKEFTFKKKS